MTIATFQVTVATVMKQRAEEMQAMSMGLQLSVGALLSKEGGATMQEYFKKTVAALETAQRTGFGQTEDDMKLIEHEKALLAKESTKNLTDHEKKKRGLITALKLDAAFKKLTGIGRTLPTLQGVNSPAAMSNVSMRDMEPRWDGIAESLMRQNDQIAAPLKKRGKIKESRRTGRGGGVGGW